LTFGCSGGIFSPGFWDAKEGRTGSPLLCFILRFWKLAKGLGGYKARLCPFGKAHFQLGSLLSSATLELSRVGFQIQVVEKVRCSTGEGNMIGIDNSGRHFQLKASYHVDPDYRRHQANESEL
jgi:hypothetical protein